MAGLREGGGGKWRQLYLNNNKKCENKGKGKKKKNGIGNGEAKELICPTHEHELKGVGNAGREVGCRVEGDKRGEMGQL